MKRLAPLLVAFLVFFAVVPASIQVPEYHNLPESNHFERATMQNDTLRPTIEEWNISESAHDGEVFDVWARVIDESGVRNVSLIISRSYYPDTSIPMTDNGTYFVASVLALTVNYTYSLQIQAFDMVNNSATSYRRTVDLTLLYANPFDESVTMPIVVGSALSLIAVVIGIAYIVHQRKKTHISSS